MYSDASATTPATTVSRGRAAHRGQPDQQSKPGQHQHFSFGAVEVAVQADDQHDRHRRALQRRRCLGCGPADREEPEGQHREPCVVAEVQAEEVVAQRQPGGQERHRNGEGPLPFQPVHDRQPAQRRPARPESTPAPRRTTADRRSCCRAGRGTCWPATDSSA